ncbi:MAG: MBL fold metallo-hydrolase [Tatlockia sp.]|jgi:ribonuclease BN (tRNA processing enzyme)
MKLLFLGVSNAFAVGTNQFQSNMLLESDSGRKMLIDCGGDARHSLHALGYSYQDIDAVYISHLHADHIGGLEWLGFCKLFNCEEKPTLYISNDQREALWTRCLSGGMSCLEEEPATLSHYFDAPNLENHHFVWENHRFQLIPAHHSMHNHHFLPCYGLFIEGTEKKAFITTDARFKQEYFTKAYQEAHLIFQDCENLVAPSNQHAQYEELKTLNPQIKNKMWLYDYQDGVLPDATKDGFKGFVTRGQSFNF